MALQPPQSLFVRQTGFFSPINLPSPGLLWLWQALCSMHSTSSASIPRGKHHFTQQSLWCLQHPCPLGETQQHLWSHCWGLLLLPPSQQTRLLRARVEQLKKETMSFLSHTKESQAWEQPTCTFRVKPTFQQLKSSLMENSALLFFMPPWAPRLVLFIRAALSIPLVLEVVPGANTHLCSASPCLVGVQGH